VVDQSFAVNTQAVGELSRVGFAAVDAVILRLLDGTS
jgi:hypothetical protein